MQTERAFEVGPVVCYEIRRISEWTVGRKATSVHCLFNCRTVMSGGAGGEGVGRPPPPQIRAKRGEKFGQKGKEEVR